MLKGISELANIKKEYYERSATGEILCDGVFLEHIGNTEATLTYEDGEEVNESIVGSPEKDDDYWHKQSESNSCAIVCQEFIAEQLLGKEFSEAELANLAKAKGWYSSAEGTSKNDIGNVLEALGLDVEKSQNLTLEDIANELDSNGKIICTINSTVLENPAYGNLKGIKSDHAVQVIGIDYSNPNKVEVILNDPGRENGQGLHIDAEVFTKAWDAGNNFAIIARK